MTTLVWLFLGMSVIITAFLTYYITKKVTTFKLRRKFKKDGTI